MPVVPLNGLYQDTIALPPRAIGFSVRFITPTSGLPDRGYYLNWRVKYFDDSLSPETFSYVTRFLFPQFYESGQNTLTINLQESGKVLGSDEDRILQLKSYARKGTLNDLMPAELVRNANNYKVYRLYSVDVLPITETTILF